MRLLANDIKSRLFVAEFTKMYYDLKARSAVIETEGDTYFAPQLSQTQTDDLCRTAFMTSEADITPYGRVYTETEYAEYIQEGLFTATD